VVFCDRAIPRAILFSPRTPRLAIAAMAEDSQEIILQLKQGCGPPRCGDGESSVVRPWPDHHSHATAPGSRSDQGQEAIFEFLSVCEFRNEK
jgi:hypothetical protein